MNNRYFIMRHGESKANVAEIIVSNLEDSVKEEYSLTEKGEEDVRISIEDAKNNTLLGSATIIYSSPFSRCKRTAEIARDVLKVKDEIIFDERLKERWFGNLDKTHGKSYQKVWSADAAGSNPVENEEPAEDVEKRTTSLIAELEKQYTNKTFLLVSHGDVLQILEASVGKLSARQHRSVKPLEKAEIRRLNNIY